MSARSNEPDRAQPDLCLELVEDVDLMERERDGNFDVISLLAIEQWDRILLCEMLISNNCTSICNSTLLGVGTRDMNRLTYMYIIFSPQFT